MAFSAPRMNPAAAPLWQAMLVAVIGIGSFSVMDGVMKTAAIAAGAFSAMILRNMMAASIMAPFWFRQNSPFPRGTVLRLHVLRGAISSAMGFLFFWGLVRTPLAESIALSFIAPLIALYLAARTLGETVSPAAITGSLLGLAGVLVIAVQKFGAHFSDDARWGLVAILASAVLYAFNLVLQRRQAQLAGPVEVTFFQTAISCGFLLPFAFWHFTLPSLAILGWIMAGAVLTIISLLLLSWAYGQAEAQALVSTEYTAFLWAVLIGWLLHDEQPGLSLLAGAALIVIGCLIAARYGRNGAVDKAAITAQ